MSVVPKRLLATGEEVGELCTMKFGRKFYNGKIMAIGEIINKII